jgi:glycosyltransferase involved in cell wall biosynthesis
LLLNDGSTDSTLEICKSYAARDNRIRLFTHENKGVSFTRNRGIREASGELIFFVDGDDCIKQNFIQRHIDSFHEGVLVISGFENNSDRMQSHAFVKLLEQYKNKDISIQNILKVLKYDSLNSPCCRLFERDILIKNNVFFNELLSYQEDIVFNLSYCKFIDSIRPIDFLGYYYINNPNSSSSKFHKNLNYTENLFQELSLFIIDEDDHNSISKFIFETLFFKISNIFHQNTEFTIKNRLKYLDEVKTAIDWVNINKAYADVKGYKTQSKIYHKLIYDLEHAMLAKDKTLAEQLLYEAKQKKETLINAKAKRSAKNVVFDTDRFSQSRKDAAGYYSYKWAEVLDADAFSVFKKNGIFDQKTAQSFRDNVLSKGGTEHPMVLYKRFRGQEPTIDALLERNEIKVQHKG